ncbi:MAG TPA: hypothetical protein VGB31_09200, partial [Myxococcota bacterium]
ASHVWKFGIIECVSIELEADAMEVSSSCLDANRNQAVLDFRMGGAKLRYPGEQRIPVVKHLTLQKQLERRFDRQIAQGLCYGAWIFENPKPAPDQALDPRFNFSRWVFEGR